MAKKYEEKKKFHTAHNADRPKEESAKEKVLKSVFSHGKKLAVKARQKAQEEAVRQAKNSKKPKGKTKIQTKKSRPEPRSPTPMFGSGFDNQFGYDMFRPKKDSAEPKPFDFGFNADYDKLFDFRPKKKKSSMNDIWNPEDFWR